MALASAVSFVAGQAWRAAPALLQLRNFNTSTAPRDVPQPVPLAKLKDSFNDGTSIAYLEELEQRYKADPNSVDRTWGMFFKALESGVPGEAIAEAYDAFEKGQVVSPLAAAAVSNQTIQESMKLLLLVRSYQVNGHFDATLDPLGLDKRPKHIELDPASYGFTEADLDREFFLGTWSMSGFLNEARPIRTLREIQTRLRETYCGNIGYEYMHIPDRDRCNWLRERIETPEPEPFSIQKKKHTLDRLAWSDMFETFLANKYTAAKRFGLEGCETLIPGMKAMIDRITDLDCQNIVIGMPHRGRLNVLANVVRKPMAQIFSEFSGKKLKGPDDREYTGSGDVKYHLGTSYNRPTVNGKMVHLSLMANPSHLEAVNTLVLGKTRAKQFYSDDVERSKSAAVLLHGDGAFSGQGIVFETLDLCGLFDYTVGGTIHLVVNNQVAFTTDPKESRSSPYCTDVAKALNLPIFHVNADDVESVVRVCELAAEWRQTWKTDVVIDLVCYRKHGHNEIDEPMFTQPLMYKAIRQHKNAHQQYVERLLAEGSLDKAQVRAIHDRVQELLNQEYEASRSYRPSTKDWLASHWTGFMSPVQLSRIRNTGVNIDVLKSVGRAITALPEWFTPHRQIKKIYESRRQMIESGQEVDWATAEALAFATLLSEGNHVRLSGQDVERGTFSHRHAVLHDQNDGSKYVPMAHVFPGQKPWQFTVTNSSLSEYGVLGFELGYSMENPNSLVLWEAQFGDFANTAQVIFDQFISSGESKWLRQSGLVCLLPHGYDGQGPEHSSARMERFLQMSDENPYLLPKVETRDWFTGSHLGTQIQNTNWQVVNCTTPANYFHVLRRQVMRQFRKPLIVFSPKNLLRHPKCKSPLAEFDDVPDDLGIVGVRFKRLIMDDGGIMPKSRAPRPPQEEGYKRVVFCTGKVFYELHAERERLGLTDQISLVRLEQLAPFPFDLVCREIYRYPNAELVWCQEEPMNMGAYFHVQVIFDQFISSGESKWLRQSGLVCLLPHGYDGQGPEHSSARMERFLQMSDENPYLLPKVETRDWFTGSHLGTQIQNTNWQVVNCTTPANYFHVLRRQVMRQFRKPLIVFSPKNLLRHPKCKSPLAEFDDVPDDLGIVGVRFKRLIMDDGGIMPKSRAPRPPQEEGYKRVVFCTGKVFYELHAERERLGLTDQISLVRLEQLAPFPFDLVCREIYRYPNAELVWCQEEPMNMGAYFHVQPRMESCMRQEGRATTGRVTYCGREPSASTATGYGEVHTQEQAGLIANALDLAYKMPYGEL